MALTQPDLGVLRKAQRGDERAFTILVRAYERPVYNYVLRLVGNRDMAEDLTQEVFLRVYQGLPGFSLRSRFTTWLFQVTKNRVLDELRALERRPRAVVTLDDIPPLEVLDAPVEHDDRGLLHGSWNMRVAKHGSLASADQGRPSSRCLSSSSRGSLPNHADRTASAKSLPGISVPLVLGPFRLVPLSGT